MESCTLKMLPTLLNLMNSYFELINDECFDAIQTQLKSSVHFCAVPINFRTYFMHEENANLQKSHSEY